MSPAAAVTAAGDGSMTITEATGADEPRDDAALATLFPTTDANGYPWFPASNAPTTCVTSSTSGIYAGATSSLPCGTNPTDLPNGDGISDRFVIDGYVIVPDGASSIQLRGFNVNPRTNRDQAGAIHIYVNTGGDDRTAMTYQDGAGRTGARPVRPTTPVMAVPGAASGCVSIPAMAYRIYVFDGHSGMTAAIHWSVVGGAQDTGGAFTTIPTAFLSSVAGYDNDLDSNGTADYLEADTDSDGIPDVAEGYGDADSDNIADCADAPDTTPDSSSGNTCDTAVNIDVTGNDTGPNIDPATVVLVGADANGEIVVAGEGTWSVSATGIITFTPEPGAACVDPTPIQYQVDDTTGQPSPPTGVIVEFVPGAEHDASTDNTCGATVTIDVTANDGMVDPTTVVLVGADANGEIVVAGEGTWSVDASGIITFTPLPGAACVDPAPISYEVDGTDGEPVAAEVTLDYGPEADDDESLDNPAGSTVTVDVVANDSDVDPTTVEIVGADTNGDLAVAGEGTWTVDPVTGEITFTPEAGFNGDPTPITYVAANSLGVPASPATVTVGYTAPAAAVPGTLPITGSSTDEFSGIGIALLVLGALFLTLEVRLRDYTD